MFDLMGKFQEMQAKMEETKAKLDSIIVTGEAGGGVVSVKVTASKKMHNVEISENLLADADKEQLEDLILVATNRAMEQAEVKAAEEMKAVTGGMLPNIPGLGF